MYHGKQLIHIEIESQIQGLKQKYMKTKHIGLQAPSLYSNIIERKKSVDKDNQQIEFNSNSMACTHV